MIKTLLTEARDAVWMWNLFGSLYNSQITGAIGELYEDIAQESAFARCGRALDVGCGAGYLTLLLAARYPASSFTGIDFSIAQVRIAEKARQKTDAANCTFRHGNAMSIPYAEGRFDIVLSAGSIKHWPDPEQGLAEIRRVLAPEGRMLVAETDKDATPEDIRRFAGRFAAWYSWDRLLVWGLRHIIFGRSLSGEEIVDLARRAGFRNIQTEKHAFCPYVIVKAQK